MSATVSQAAGAAPASRVLTYRAIAAITIGSALEFFEFSVFSFFATLIGRQFSRHKVSSVSYCWRWRPSDWAS